MNDLVVDSNGRCFVCIEPTSPNFTSIKVGPDDEPSSSSSLRSFHYLTRFLKMDLRKVLDDKDSIPVQLLEKVQKSILKVELCEECSTLTNQFSKLFRQLEKIEMEVEAVLSRIHQKFLATEDTDDVSVSNLMISKTGEFREKRKIMEILRKEAIQKAASKLSSSYPRVKVGSLSQRGINAEKRKIKSSVGTATLASDMGSIGYDYQPDDETDVGSDLNLERSFTASDLGDHEPDVMDLPSQVKLEVCEGGKEDLPEEGSANSGHGNASRHQPKRTIKSRTTKSSKMVKAEEYLGAIPPPLTVTGDSDNVVKPRIPINSQSGKYVCPLCSRGYTAHKNFLGHFRSAHMKIAYQCTTCHSKFGRKQHYETHYLKFHNGIQFKCTMCDKIFDYERNLLHHRKIIHMGQRYKCTCSKTFRQAHSLRLHMQKGCAKTHKK